MDKEEWKSFFRFIDEGSEAELQQRKGTLAGVLAKVTDPWTRVSLSLQAAFGLRREESMKIQPGWADQGDRLALQESWAKGKRAREVPIRTDKQRQVLEAAKQLAVKGSLIPGGSSYVEQLMRFKAQCEKAGIHGVHGHRHQFAQDRYRELTGWLCPAQGGPSHKQLTREQRAIDREARMVITDELGHGRENVVGVYCGK